MSHKVLLTVDGESRRLLTYHHNYYRQKRKMKSFDTQNIFAAPLACDLRNGYRFDDFEHFSEPLPQIFGGMFYISFEATDKDDLFYYWMKNSAVLDGRIEFFRTVDEDDIPFQRIDFWDAFLGRIKEQATQGIVPMTMECDISAAIVRINKDKDTTVRKSWYFSDIDEKPISIYVAATEEQEPEITKICFKDADGNEIIDNIPTDDIVSLYAETVGFNEGDDVEFKIELLSGEATVKAKIGKDGIVEIKNYKLIL